MRHHKLLSAVIPLLLLTLWFIPSTGAPKPEPANPGIAVLAFKNKADNQWWFHGGAEAAQDVFIAELAKSGKFDVLGREQLEDLMQQKNLPIRGDINPTTAVKVGKLLGVNYLLTGTLTQYGPPATGGRGTLNAGKRPFVAAMNAQLIDTSTGKVAWSDQASSQGPTTVSVFGVGGNPEEDKRQFESLMKPLIQKLVASLLKGR